LSCSGLTCSSEPTQPDLRSTADAALRSIVGGSVREILSRTDISVSALPLSLCVTRCICETLLACPIGQHMKVVRFQVLTTASMMFRIVFWDTLPCKIIVDPDDGGSTHVWNVGRQSFYTAVYPRRQFWTSYESRFLCWIWSYFLNECCDYKT
jgi:hypothetical protein